MTDRSNPEGNLPADESPVSEFRLEKVLAKRRDIEGGYAALARAITLSWRGDPARKPEKPTKKAGSSDSDIIDRRKLARLIERKDGLVLSLDDLRALDGYLERYGEGLAFRPLFEKPDIMRMLADSGHVTFLLGSKLEEEGGSFSHWDVLAMAEIQRSITASSELSVQLDIQNVQLYPKPEDPKSSTRAGWREQFDERGRSLIVLASSRTIPAAEVMQCAMFGCPEFEDGPLEQKRTLPIHFVWNPELPYVFPSQFHLRPEDIKATDRTAAHLIANGEASAIAVGEQIYIDQVRSRHYGDTYGVCFAQRRTHEQVWLLLAGVTGAATFAAAKVAKRLATRLREAKPSEIHCFVIRAHVEPGQWESLGGLRDANVEVVYQEVWHGEPQ